MFVIPYTTPTYLFGKKFAASFEVEENRSSFENTIFSGIVESGTFSINDTVYIMNCNYKVIAYGKVNDIITYSGSTESISTNDYATNFEITTSLPEVNEPIFIIKPDPSHMQDLFIIKSKSEDIFFIDYAFDFKSAICKFLNGNFEISEDAFESTWSNISEAQVKQIMSNLNAEGRDEIDTEDGKIELIYIPEA